MRLGGPSSLGSAPHWSMSGGEHAARHQERPSRDDDQSGRRLPAATPPTVDHRGRPATGIAPELRRHHVEQLDACVAEGAVPAQRALEVGAAGRLITDERSPRVPRAPGA